MATSRKQRAARKLNKAKGLLKKANKEANAGVKGAPDRIAIHEATILALEIPGAPRRPGHGPL